MTLIYSFSGLPRLYRLRAVFSAFVNALAYSGSGLGSLTGLGTPGVFTSSARTLSAFTVSSLGCPLYLRSSHGVPVGLRGLPPSRAVAMLPVCRISAREPLFVADLQSQRPPEGSWATPSGLFTRLGGSQRRAAC